MTRRQPNFDPLLDDSPDLGVPERERGTEQPSPGEMVAEFLHSETSSVSEQTLHRLMRRHLPSFRPTVDFRRGVMLRAANEGALLAWNRRSLRAPAGALERLRAGARGATALAVVVIGCGLGILGTVLGTVVTSLGLAGSAVWSSRLALQLWTWTSEMASLVFGTAEITRRAWLASSSTTIFVVLIACIVASSAGLVALHRLRSTPMPNFEDSEPAR